MSDQQDIADAEAFKRLGSMKEVLRESMIAPTTFEYSRWRHGGWYVHNVRYPNGAIGCVSRNYADRKWRIACDPRGFENGPTFKSRDEAAAAEMELARAEVQS